MFLIYNAYKIIAHRNNFHLIKTYNRCNNKVSKRYIGITNCKAKIQHEQKRKKVRIKRTFWEMNKSVNERYKCSKIQIILMKDSYVINNIYQSIRKVPHFYSLLVTTA